MDDLFNIFPPYDLKPLVPKHLIYFHPILHDAPQTTLVLDNLNQNRTYTVHYYDPFSGEYFEPMDFEPENCSLGSGNEGFLRLYHPELTWSRPILFFELYDTGISGLRSTQTNTTSGDSLQFVPSHVEQFDTDSGNVDNFEMSVYPNPSTGIVDVKISTDCKVEFELFDSTGRLLEQGSANRFFQLNLHISGDYLIRVNSPMGFKYERITIVK